MEKELRFGKYTEEEIEKILVGGLFPNEQEILNKGLQFFELTFQDYFFCDDHSIFDGEDSNINMLELPSHTLIKRIHEKLENTTHEQIPWFDEFQLISLNVLYLNIKFLKAIGQEEVAKASIEGVLENNEEFRKRFLKDYPEEKLGASFLRMKEELDTLINSKGKLVWKGNSKSLSLLSEKLHNNSTTTYKLDFENVFTKQKKCGVNDQDLDFFSCLIYKLIDSPINFIGKLDGSSWGTKGLSEHYFYNNSSKNYELISFHDRISRLRKDADKHAKIKELVDNFIKEIL